MVKRLVVSASAISALVLASSGLAFGQARIGPGEQRGVAGAQTEFAFSLTRGGANVAVFGFNIVVTTAVAAAVEPVLKPDGQPGEIDCTVEPDLRDVLALVFDLRPAQNVFAVSFGDLSFPLTNIPRDGVVGRCKFRITTNTPPGQIPLLCDPTQGATSAADANGDDVSVTCADGVLVVEVPPTFTPTNTAAPNTPTNTPAATRAPTNTPPRTPTATVPRARDDEDDGCHIGAQSSSMMSWLLLAPVAPLVWRRRRAR